MRDSKTVEISEKQKKASSIKSVNTCTKKSVKLFIQSLAVQLINKEDNIESIIENIDQGGEQLIMIRQLLNTVKVLNV